MTLTEPVEIPCEHEDLVNNLQALKINMKIFKALLINYIYIQIYIPLTHIYWTLQSKVNK